MWHAFSKKHTSGLSTKDTEKFIEKYTTGDKGTFLHALLCDLKNDKMVNNWMGKVKKPNDRRSGAQPKGEEGNKHVKDATMLLLPEAHDSYTRVTLQIKKLGVQIMNSGGSESVKTVQGRSMQILKDMVPASEKIEQALSHTPRDQLNESEVMGIVSQAVSGCRGQCSSQQLRIKTSTQFVIQCSPSRRPTTAWRPTTTTTTTP